MTKKNEAKFEMKKIAGSKIKLEMFLPGKSFDEIIKKTAEDISKNTKIDGFRKGKVPFDIIKKTVGEDKILQESAERALQSFYVDYVIKNKIEVIGQPKVEFKKIAFGNDLEIGIEVAVLPEVVLNSGWKEEISKINKNNKQKDIEIDDSEIQKELTVLAKQRAKISTVDRGAEKGDQIQIDFEAFKDNVILEGGSAQNHTLIIGEGRFIPGFEDNLIGMKAGEIREFDLKFPKNYHAKHLADQKVVFKTIMKNVQQREVPELNDDFAKNIGKFKNLEEIKDNIKKGLKDERENQNRQKLHITILDKLIDKTKIEIPEVLVVSEIEKMNMELDGQLAQMGLDRNIYLQQIGTTVEKLENQWREKDAPKRVKAALILRHLAIENKIQPESKDVQDRVNQIIQHYQLMSQGKKNDNIDIQRIYNNIKNEMTNEMTLKYLMEL